MDDGDYFINAVSGIVNRGCFDPVRLMLMLHDSKFNFTDSFSQLKLHLIFISCTIAFVIQPCNTGAVDGLSERAANFKKVLSIFLSENTGTT